ncbi:MAG: M20/M25/M40 family metallo-hydrolase [Chitinophagaceae bacterium]|nr:M20/M25/M40 family metallo-hydrolase [Chitinophagaceae bacterium]
MHKKILSLLVMGLFLSGFAVAQTDDSIAIRKISNELLANGTAYENLRYLCKQVGPRLSGSPQAQKSVEATFKMLKDAGADTVFLQPCMVPHWVRGDKEKGFIKLYDGTKYNLNLCALGNSEGTGKKGLTADVIEVKNFAELDKLGTEGVKDKIVFFNYPMNPTYVRSFMAYGESGVYRTRGPAAAAKYGAAAVMVRSLASNLDDFPHTGTTIYNDSFPKIPAVAISTNDAEWLSKQLKNNVVVSAFIRNTSTMLADAPSFNVVGELWGSEFPNEFITVGGHLDSWDLAEGAQDDGAGCVQSIEVIRTFKALGIKPKHTIRAVMFMNEENGTRGAAKYLELAKLNNEKHIFALESDAGGFTPRGFGISAKTEQMAKISGWKDLFFDYGVYQFTAGGGGADIGPLREIGAALAGLGTDSQRYFDLHHASTDTFEAVSKRELHLGAVNMTALIYLVDKYGL